MSLPAYDFSRLPLAMEPPEPPPTQDDLPCDDGVPMETFRHKRQMDFLIDAMDDWLERRGNGFAGGNMFMYYSLSQAKNNDFVGPDFFIALDVPLGERKSWVGWEEGKNPDLVIELLSTSTKKYDKTEKKERYARLLRVPEYFWFDPWNPNDFAGFVLNGGGYRPLEPDARGWLYSKQLDLYLGHWEGRYKGIDAIWIRWFTKDGEVVPTEGDLLRAAQRDAKQRVDAAEQHAQFADQQARQALLEAQDAEQLAQRETHRADEEARRAEEEARRADEEAQRAEKLAAQLRALGIDPAA